MTTVVSRFSDFPIFRFSETFSLFLLCPTKRPADDRALRFVYDDL
jgi:hypothetical protein